MSAVLDLHPTPGHPGGVIAAVHTVLDELGPIEPDALAGEITTAVVQTECAIRRLQSLKLKLLAAAEQAQVPAAGGHRTTGSWLATHTRGAQAAAAREARLAGALDHDLPATAAALADGALSPDHAAVIAEATRRLPDHLTPEQTATVETSLVHRATRLDPTQLRRVARRALAAVEPDTRAVDAHENTLLEAEEDHAQTQARLSLHENPDGTTTGHFTVPTLAATILRKILDAMTAPRAHHLPHTGTGAGTAGGQRPDPAHQRGLAFTQLLHHLPTDHLHSAVAATIIVTLDHDTLRDQLKAAHLDTGETISAAQARHLACNAGLIPAVLNTTSLPLDLGRRTRLFTETQRLAGATHHTTCAATNCHTPYAWCELHHHTRWSHGGTTNLHNLLPLCGHHHRLLHHDPGRVRLRSATEIRSVRMRT